MKHITNTSYFILFIFAPLLSWSIESSRILTGRVTSMDQAAPFVTISIEGTTRGITTNSEGYFNLPIDNTNNISLKVQGVGYKTSQVHVKSNDLINGISIDIEPDTLQIEQVIVSGSRVGVLRYLPGSVAIISSKEIAQQQPISGNEVFRNLSGVNVVDEEGAGLRLNIGIRGLDPDRSRNVLILEDGIPVALAPYGEPEMYYTPNISRMSGVEILKGNGSILFGPQTIGGVLNYITADAPKESSGQISLTGGDFGYNNSQVQYGNTIGSTGFNLNLTRKEVQNLGPTQFLLHDINAKLLNNLSATSQLVLKLGLYNENSNSTYVGQTQPMYDAGEMDNQPIAPDDALDINRYSLSVNYRNILSDRLQLNTTVFGYTTTRNWNRQDFTFNSSASNQTGVMYGEDDGSSGAIYLLNSTGQRNRQFEVAGVEPRVKFSYSMGGLDATLEGGIRYLYERAYEQRVNGMYAGALSGSLQDDEVRAGQALSSYMQNQLHISRKLSVMLGLRNENIFYEREIMRSRNQDTLISNSTSNSTLIPAIGLNYNITDQIGLFSGIHRGYAPPRTKDAISNDGVDLELEAELSWNSEVGVRAAWSRFKGEVSAFRMDFSNQIIPVSESSGGAGTGYINGGRTINYGVESSVAFLFIQPSEVGWNGRITLCGTWVHTEFSADRFVLQKVAISDGYEDYNMNIKGNRTPYAPAFTLAGGLQVEAPSGIGISITGNYVGSQYTDVLNTENVYNWIALDGNDEHYRYTQSTTNGRIGRIEAYHTINLSTWYTHQRSGLGFNLSVKNLTNERYIVSRRPQGIRVGSPRFVTAGVSYEF